MGGSGGKQGSHGSREGSKFAARARALGLAKYHESEHGGFKYVTTVSKDGRVTVTAFSANGQQVGSAAFAPRPGKKLYPGDVVVHEDFRRRGIATRMYDLAKEQSGAREIVNASVQQPDGKLFRQRYKG